MLELVYVTAPRCHHCERGRRVLARLADRYPVTWREVDLASAEGEAAQARWRPPFPPLVLAGEELVAHGRLSERRLARQLEARLDGGTDGVTVPRQGGSRG